MWGISSCSSCVLFTLSFHYKAFLFLLFLQCRPLSSSFSLLLRACILPRISLGVNLAAHEGIYLPTWVNCFIRPLHTFCGWRDLFRGVKCEAVNPRSRRKSWHKCNWRGHSVLPGHWKSVPFLKYYSHSLWVTHTFIFCCPCFCCPCARQVSLLHKKIGKDREVGVWCLWHLHLSFLLPSPSLLPSFPPSLSPFSFLQVRYFQWSFCDLISSHDDTCVCLSTVWPMRSLWNPGQVICVSVFGKTQKGLVYFRSHAAFCKLVLVSLLS